MNAKQIIIVAAVSTATVLVMKRLGVLDWIANAT